MPQAIGDPDELDNFAHTLSQFVDTMNDAVGGLNAAFGSLGDTWQDQKRMQFEESYEALIQTLSQFETVAEDQVSYLHSLAARLRDYLES